MNKFVQTFLKTEEGVVGVDVKPLPNSECGYCFRNVDEFCKKIKTAEPVLCWQLFQFGNQIVGNLHAIIRMKGRLIDITPPAFPMLVSKGVVLEKRMCVVEARRLTRETGKTFFDVTSPEIPQENGLDFFNMSKCL